MGGGRQGPGRARPISTGWRSAARTSSSSSRRCRRRAIPTSSPSATAPIWCRRAQTQPIPPRAQAAHQEASHLVTAAAAAPARRAAAAVPLSRLRLAGLARRLFDRRQPHGLHRRARRCCIEGLFAKLMYRSLYKMHEMALHGPWKVIARHALAPARRGAPSRTSSCTNPILRVQSGRRVLSREPRLRRRRPGVEAALVDGRAPSPPSGPDRSTC